MPNPLPYHYQETIGGSVRAGKDGYFTLEIGTKELVEKRLVEILPFMSGIEKRQIEILLQIIAIRKIRLPKLLKRKRIKELFDQWKECSEELENWMKTFKANYRDVKKKKIPTKIWNKAYSLENNDP